MVEGVHPAFEYAQRKLGFVVVDINRHLFDQDDIDAWEAAIDEWLAAHPGEEGP